MKKVEVKSVLKSKTFYFGILSILLAVANLFGYGDYQPEGYANEALELVNGLAIIFLRFKTSEKVKL